MRGRGGRRRRGGRCERLADRGGLGVSEGQPLSLSASESVITTGHLSEIWTEHANTRLQALSHAVPWTAPLGRRHPRHHPGRTGRTACTTFLAAVATQRLLCQVALLSTSLLLNDPASFTHPPSSHLCRCFLARERCDRSFLALSSAAGLGESLIAIPDQASSKRPHTNSNPDLLLCACVAFEVPLALETPVKGAFVPCCFTTLTGLHFTVDKRPSLSLLGHSNATITRSSSPPTIRGYWQPSPTMAPTTRPLALPLNLLALLSLLQLSPPTAAQCYYPNGAINTVDGACPNSDLCCPLGWQCLSNGLCQLPGSDPVLERHTCTDETWSSSECPNFCTYSEAGNEMILRCRDGSYCCDGNGE